MPPSPSALAALALFSSFFFLDTIHACWSRTVGPRRGSPAATPFPLALPRSAVDASGASAAVRRDKVGVLASKRSRTHRSDPVWLRGTVAQVGR
jgi:hypothetical protein